MLDYKFVMHRPVPIEEDLHHEFKEMKGASPVKIIKNTVDEYVVAYLNSRVAGSIFWGIRDSDRQVVGVSLEYQERDRLRKDVISKLSNIQPAISPTEFTVPLHKIYESPGGDRTIPDLYVVEVAVPEVHSDDLYFTGGNEAFVKTDAGKKKLSGPALQDEVLRRLQEKIKSVQKVVNESNEFFGFSSVLRRAELVASVVEGAQLLWVDDNPGNNLYERMTFKSIGMIVDIALSTMEAKQMLSFGKYDAIISDMARYGETQAGQKLLQTLRSNDIDIPLVFYTWWEGEEQATPLGAFGMTKYPDELIHLVIDILERRRI